MTDDRRLESIEKKLDAHGDKLDTINETLKTIAVQDERIKTRERKRVSKHCIQTLQAPQG
jgi:hypothetical protein